MNKSIALILIALMVVQAVSALVSQSDIPFRAGGPQRLGEYFYDPRVQSTQFDINVPLEPVKPPIFARGYPPYYPRGHARLTSVRNPFRPLGQAIIYVKDVRPTSQDNSLYQAWLYDADSGYLLNLGKFDTSASVGQLHYTGKHYFDVYDYVLLTREPRVDPDPRPSNDEVLIGRIVPATAYQPMPLLRGKAQSGYSYRVS
jgi:hypothetical protein